MSSVPGTERGGSFLFGNADSDICCGLCVLGLVSCLPLTVTCRLGLLSCREFTGSGQDCQWRWNLNL